MKVYVLGRNGWHIYGIMTFGNATFRTEQLTSVPTRLYLQVRCRHLGSCSQPSRPCRRCRTHVYTPQRYHRARCPVLP